MSIIPKMSKIVTSFVFICLTFGLSCFGQTKKDLNDKDLKSKANLFIEKLSSIINEGNIERIKSELIVSKQDLRYFLDKEWKRKYNSFTRRKMQDKLEPSVEKIWKEIQKKDGYFLIGSMLTEKDRFSKEKIIHPIIKNGNFRETTVNISDKFDSNKGQISSLRLINVNTLVVGYNDPVYNHIYNFPCILTIDGDLKIVGIVNGKLIPIDKKNE
ncbi:MAG: hypothetical protein IPO14_07030 [Saprospiraceae bacterium]|nr:hypothetical protein [Saprospiraceae bacterium]